MNIPPEPLSSTDGRGPPEQNRALAKETSPYLVAELPVAEDTLNIQVDIASRRQEAAQRKAKGIHPTLLKGSNMCC